MQNLSDSFIYTGMTGEQILSTRELLEKVVGFEPMKSIFELSKYEKKVFSTLLLITLFTGLYLKGC